MLSNAQTNSRFEIWDDSEIAQENQTECDEFVHVPNETLEFKNTLKLNKGYHSASFIVNKDFIDIDDNSKRKEKSKLKDCLKLHSCLIASDDYQLTKVKQKKKNRMMSRLELRYLDSEEILIHIDN